VAAGWLYYSGITILVTGLMMLTQSLAVDHAAQELRANVVCPGWTVTEMADAEMTAFGESRGLTVAVDVGTVPFDPRVRIRQDL
jgi:NAD(P)-dependent dehydrogenase (short-subunit alcohol dehydrogenase family)